MLRQVDTRAEIAILPARMGLVHREGKVGAEQGDTRRTHPHRQVDRRVQHTAADKQQAALALLTHRGIDRADGITAVAWTFPGMQHLGIAHRHIDQGNAIGGFDGQMSETDALVDADHDIRSDPLLTQRPVGSVDADEQRPFRLLADRAQLGELLFQRWSGADHIDVLARARRKQFGDITVCTKHLAGVQQTLEDDRGLRIELAIVEGQVHLADQTITHPRVVVIGQHQFGRQRKKRQENLGVVGGIAQFDPWVPQPGLLIQQPQHQLEQRAIKDMDTQALQGRPLQQDLLQIAQPGAVEVQQGAVRRQAGSLQAGLGDAIMPAGELDAAHAQGRAQPLHQLNRQRLAVLGQQPRQQARPTIANGLQILLETFAHAASLNIRAKKWRSRLSHLERHFATFGIKADE